MNGPAFVRVLGPVQIVGEDGLTNDLGSRNQRRMLAVLAINSGQVLRPDYLGELLGLAGGALRTGVSRLRRNLGPGALQSYSGGYRLDSPVDADLFTDLVTRVRPGTDRLADLDEALGHWRGAALAEFVDEPWAAPDALRLDELRSLAIEERAGELIRRGRTGEAIAALRAHVAASPIRERSYALLMQALTLEGRQADALRAYQDYRTYLIDEVGTEPSEHIRSVERRVATGWDGHDDWNGSGGPASLRESAPGPGRNDGIVSIPLQGVLSQRWRLVGRQAELAELNADIGSLAGGMWRTVLLGGEAGIGKTTVLAAFARSFHESAGGTFVYGRCAEGAAVPLQPFRDIVGAIVDHAPLDLLSAHVATKGGELRRIAPQLAWRVPNAPLPTVTDEATERYVLFEAVVDLLRRVSQRCPLVLALDDLHWAEPTALLLLRHLARALNDAPVLAIVGYRDTGVDVTDDLRSTLVDLERGDTRRVSLSGFDRAELAELIESMANGSLDAGSVLVDHLLDETAGHPLYTGQLVRHLIESGRIEVDDAGVRSAGDVRDVVAPPRLQDIVWSRAGALGETAAEVLAAASVLGLEFDRDLLVEIVDESETEVLEGLDAAMAARLLDRDPGPRLPLRFAHGLLVHALYEQLLPNRRRSLHERAARAYEKGEDTHPQSVVVELARHWELAGNAQAALHWSTKAGDLALANLAAAEAARWFTLALDHAAEVGAGPEVEADLLVRLGRAQHRAGQPARETLLRAAEIARRCGADGILIQAALATDRGILGANVDLALIDVIEAAITAADAADDRVDEATLARLLALFGRELTHTDRAEDRRAATLRALGIVDRANDERLLAELAMPLMHALWGAGSGSVRRDLARRAIAAAEATGDPFLSFRAYDAAYRLAIEVADAAGARLSSERMRSIANAVGEPRLRWLVMLTDTFEAMMRPDLEEAERLAGVLLELGTQLGDTDAFSIYAAQILVNRTFSGRHAEVLPLVEAAMQATPMFVFRLMHAILCEAAGRVDEAQAFLDAGVADGFSHLPLDSIWMTAIIGYAVLAIELQDASAAAELFPILEPFADEVAFSGITSQGSIGAYVGNLASILGRHDVAEQHLRAALALAESFGWDYHRARTMAALAVAQRRRTGGFDAEALAWLETSSELGMRYGLQGVAAHAERLLAEARR